MDKKKLLMIFSFALLLCSCVSQSYDVQSVCEVTDLYNYVLKWEISPRMEGEVMIYSSNDPEKFDMRRCVAKEKISKGRADIVVKGSLDRRYFLLKFDDETTSVVGVRAQKLEMVENFRDMGGYLNNDHQTLKWGKLYRSGNIDSIRGVNAKRIEKMRVRTLLDFRMNPFITEAPKETGIPHYENLPIRTTRQNALPLILQKKFKRGDAVIYMQDVSREMILISGDSFKRMFEILSEEKNYPVILSCKYGNLQTSIAAALVLYALDVPEQSIIDDYLLSNRYFNMRKLAVIAYDLPLEYQDAITSMIISDERYLMTAIDVVKRKYGSVNEYLKEELGVDEAYKNKLKAILLD
ncbi:MAG: tyrosine-protein phosphatase [Bacteroidales bacterium]